MNIFSQLFGIFRQRGLVETYKQGNRLTGFFISAFLLIIIAGALYGFAMGIGISIDTAFKAVIKLPLISILGLLLSIPIFWVAYRLLGHQVRSGQVAGVPTTLVATVAMILIVTSSIVFMLSILTGYNPYAVYIHVIIINLALLVGLYLTGTLIYYGFPERKGLVIPNVISLLLMGVIYAVLLSFLSPLLEPTRSFSVGTDRLLSGLGIGVADSVDQALAAAAAADRVSYTFQTSNENGDLVRDYQVTRVGDDSMLELHSHAITGETVFSDARIWVLDGNCYFDDGAGQVAQVECAEVAAMLDPALPPAVFTLPAEFGQASWRAYESGGLTTATGTNTGQQQAKLIMFTATGRLAELVVGSALKGVHSETRVKELSPTDLDRAGLEASLNKAAVLGSVDRSDASMQDYVQEETLFVVRYPRNWNALSWNQTKQSIDFAARTGYPEGIPGLTLTVFDLAEDKGARQYAEDLARSLELQAEYRDITSAETMIDGRPVGLIEYLRDRTVKGEIETVHHIEYIFPGQLVRYHLDFSAPEIRFEDHRDLFAAMAEQFTYLHEDLWEQSR